MHILYELGREDHQFRLRFNGQFLKDSLTIDDYSLVDNAVLKMVPMTKEYDVSLKSNRDILTSTSRVISVYDTDTIVVTAGRAVSG